MTTPNTPRIPDSIDIQRLQAMQLVAKMKESAEKHGIGFIGGFISPDGQKFVMTNMEDQDDINALMPEDLKWPKNTPLFHPILCFKNGLEITTINAKALELYLLKLHNGVQILN